MAGAISYVELPVREYDRAGEFYESVFDYAVEDSPVGEYQYAIISSDEREIGAIVGTGSIRYGDESVSTSRDRRAVHSSISPWMNDSKTISRPSKRTVAPSV